MQLAKKEVEASRQLFNQKMASPGDDAKTQEEAATTVRVRFVGLLGREGVLAVPGATDAAGLSRLVAHLGVGHNNDDERRCLGFLAAGRLLQTSLARHVTIFGVSTEDVVSIEVVAGGVGLGAESTARRTEDWIGALCSSGSDLHVGCYDGSVDGERLHEGAVKALAATATKRASAGHDARVALRDGKSVRTLPEAHSSSVDCLAFYGEAVLLSGDFAGMLFAWGADDAPEGSAPATTQKAHAECVSAVVPGAGWLATASWDHTVKLWDPARIDLLQTSPLCGAALLDLAANGRSAFASAGHDGTVRLYDARLRLDHTTAYGGAAAAPVAALAFLDDLRLVAAAHDGTVHLFDLRAVNPVSSAHLPPDECPLALCLHAGALYLGGKASTLRKLDLK